MKNIILWRKDENFDKQDLDAFMREPANQAGTLQVEMGLRTYGESVMSLRHERNHRRHHLSKLMNELKPSRTDVKDKREMKTRTMPLCQGVKRKLEEELTPCLNDECREKGGRHFITNCQNTSEELKIKFSDS